MVNKNFCGVSRVPLLLGMLLLAGASISTFATARESSELIELRKRAPEDEIIYLVMPDRFANGDPANDRGYLAGDRLDTGFDPTHKGFFHGGDIKGIIDKLDYIQGLGATAIWLTPVFRNRPVQGESAGYHGYWPLDFTDIDPHFGTKADYKALVEAAHARGMKVYFDIVINHTADVINYRECSSCAYRGKADYPYTRKGGAEKPAINPGFMGDQAEFQTQENFARLTDNSFAYTPFIPAGQEHAKKPEWLNDVGMYHNRGDSVFRGESSQYGDFVGLDDIFTENPHVVAGMIDIYGRWIDEYGLDGFRIDTARHVNAEFWQAFVPAMLERAKARGIRNFHIFGEVMEFQPGQLARFTHVDGLPSVSDFALQAALVEAIAKDGPTDAVTEIFRGDALYNGGETAARKLVTLTGNYDVYRFARAVTLARPDASPDEVAKRVRLAYAVIMLARGIPTIYYGDEQGFTGLGDGTGPADQNSREDMFATRVASYASAPRLAATRTSTGDHFDTSHPLYRELARLANIRRTDPAIRRGEQISRASGDKPGLLAFSRVHEGQETLVAFNTSMRPIEAQVTVEPGALRWKAIQGHCAATATASGSYKVKIAPLDFVVCRAPRKFGTPR